MADVRNNVIVATERSRGGGNPNVNNMMRRFQQQAPNSTQLIGLVAVVVAGSIFLVLAGLALTVSVLAFVFFMPLILLSSPIWLPLATFFFICAAAFLSVCGFGVAVVAAAAWLYRYIKGLNPPGALRVDYARSRIYDTASHVKDYAKEYGGYLQGKVKDAAPGA